jgi:anti-sigma factor RsiW
MHEQAHPDTELLDRLRAGLLDGNTAVKSRLEHHLAACPRCREQLSIWERLVPDALGTWPVTDRQRSAALNQARQRAVSAARHHRAHRYRLLATAAVLLIAVSAGLWTLRHEFMDTTPMTTQAAGEVPDLYEDLDFYLWMANQGEDKMQKEDGSGESKANRT